jgi:hypothetical protein
MGIAADEQRREDLRRSVGVPVTPYIWARFSCGKLSWIASGDFPRSKEYTTESSEIQCRTAMSVHSTQASDYANTVPTHCIAGLRPICPLALQAVAEEEPVAGAIELSATGNPENIGTEDESDSCRL